MLKYAEWYTSKGFSVIPVGPDKRPLIESWLPYQEKAADQIQIQKWWHQWPQANVAVITGKVSGIYVIDCDTGEGIEILKRHYPVWTTPHERTPRGGIHFLFAYEPGLPTSTTIKGIIDVKGDGGYIVVTPSRNENGNKYEWLVKPGSTGFEPVPRGLLEEITQKGGVHSNSYKSPDTAQGEKPFTKGRRDNDLFNLALSLVIQGYDEEYVSDIVLTKARTCDFPEREALRKVKSAFERYERNKGGEKPEQIERSEPVTNLSDIVEHWVGQNIGSFTGKDLAVELNLTDAKDKANLRKILGRLWENGIIERDSGRIGHWRIPDRHIEQIDIFSAKSEGYPLWLPLNLTDLVIPQPRNIILVAGEPNVGKTAFLLNTAFENSMDHDVRYFSSEMGATELRTRLEKMPYHLSDWRRVKFFDRCENFQDVIGADALNIIDFLEVTKEFYMVGEYITQIYRKLKTGIAIIALQKNRQKVLKDGTITGDLGLGRERGLEKPRLYITLSRVENKNVCTIMKAKNWRRDDLNPNGMFKEFKLFKGYKFESKMGWQKPSYDEPEVEPDFIPEPDEPEQGVLPV